MNPGRLLFPRGVTVWHFVLVPPAAMGAAILLFRWVARAVLDAETIAGSTAYDVIRIASISLSMALVIAWLAVRHRREYEARIRAQNDRLMEQDRMAALGKMSAAVAHEIKNPLAGIRSACEILLRRAGERADTELGKELLFQVDRLNQSVQDLLSFARPKVSQPVSTKIESILDRVLNMAGGDPENSNIRVERMYDPAMKPVHVDREQMEQVLFNVILNACQAMNRSGTLTVATRASGRFADVAIRDTGPGIPKEIRSEIFEPFYTTKAKGTGLGLAIVRHIIHDHGGAVQVVDPDDGGPGAEFRIRLPLEA